MKNLLHNMIQDAKNIKELEKILTHIDRAEKNGLLDKDDKYELLLGIYEMAGLYYSYRAQNSFVIGLVMGMLGLFFFLNIDRWINILF